ncbi:hypothetical protein PIB30_082575 [Stylosanthes scabra]|uniref:Uncharacterized protein n=1 Tax=Stylosanthes scabra TaxID=79078 RepID=A0ABU6XRL8_9FABA|nr:hypothetical protein [Stylosanthes scabra]
MLRSNSDPNLLLFDLEIERTLRRARQVRCRIEFENNLRSQTENLASENNFAYSSDSDFDCDRLYSSNTGTSNMGDLPRITLKQMGGATSPTTTHRHACLSPSGTIPLQRRVLASPHLIPSSSP